MNRNLLGFLLASACQLAAAEPTWKSELSNPALGPHQRIAPGVLDLKVSWNGMIDSGKLSIHFAPGNTRKPDTYVVTSDAASTGAAANLFPYQSNFWAELDPTTLKPRLFNAVETDAGEKTTTTTRFSASKVTCSEISQPLPKGPPKTSAKTFLHSPVFDIFSAMLHIRSQTLADGDRIKLVVQPFKTPYLLTAMVAGREPHDGRNTIRLNVGMRRIDTKTMELRAYKKLKKDATLWLSDDQDRIPVEFRAAIFIGEIRATLAGYRKN
jgi:Protein of unknown function (DUF3108)